MPATNAGHSLKKSISFSAIGGAGSMAIHALSIIVLARILSPDEFGLMAIVLVFTSIATMFIDMGMGSALVHFQECTQKHYSTAFWFNQALGLVLMITMLLSATSIATFFHEPGLTSVTSAMSLLLIINAIAVVPMAMLQKQHAFHKIAIIELSSIFSGFLLAFVLAMYGLGVWALVASSLTTALVRSLSAFVLTKWIPMFCFKTAEFRVLWGFSGYLFGAFISNHVITKIDSILVGRLLGAHTLGLYNYSHQLANIPSSLVQSVFSRVYFSSYATYQEDAGRIKRTHFQAVRLIAFFTFPLLLFASTTTDIFISLLLGEQWSEMAPVLSFMCLIFLLDSIGMMNTPLFLSRGRTKLLFWLTLGVRSDQLLAILIGIQYGLEGLLWSLLIIRVINYYPVYHFVGKTIGFSVKEYSWNLLPVFVSSIVMALGVVWLRKTGIFENDHAIASMTGYFVVATVLYLSTLALIGKTILADISSLARSWSLTR